MNYKKILSILFALMLSALCLLCACDASPQRIRITVGMWPETASSAEYAYYEECCERFEKAYPEYELVQSAYTYNSGTVTAKAVSGQLPVVFSAPCSQTRMLASNGYVRKITEIVDEYGWTNKMDDVYKGMLTSDDEIYGVPGEGQGLGMFLNLSLLYGAGIIEKENDKYILYDQANNPLYPTTFTAVADCAATVCSRYTSKKGIAFLSADTYGGTMFENVAWNFGAAAFQTVDENGITANLNSIESVIALRWIQNICRSSLAVTSPAYLSYSDLYSCIGTSEVAIAFCNNNTITRPMTYFGLKPADVAFVPMPSNSARYSACDGTAYFFNSRATNDQVRGAMLFLKYLGRSPDTDSVAREAMNKRYQYLLEDELYVIPTIKVWKQADYLEMANEIENLYVNVNAEYYSEFIDTFPTMRRTTDYRYSEIMYKAVDDVIRKTVNTPNLYNAYSLLTDANTSFQATLQ